MNRSELLEEHIKWSERMLDEHLEWSEGLLDAHLAWVKEQAELAAAADAAKRYAQPDQAETEKAEASTNPAESDVQRSRTWIEEHIKGSRRRLETHIQRSRKRYESIVND